MTLVTVQRSPSSQSQARSECDDNESEKEETDEADELKGQDEVSDGILEKSECYFVVKGAAVILPHDECLHLHRRSFSNGAGDLQKHLQSMFYLLRPEDTLKIAVKLESVHVGRARYLVVISCQGRHHTEESCLLGIDCNDGTTIGLVLPIWADTSITLDGDGGFSLSSSGRKHIFKPVSVQAMWSALQTLHKASAKARDNNSYMCGGSHQWVIHYENSIGSDQSHLNEWNAMDDLVSKRAPSPDSVLSTSSEREETQKVIRAKLKEVMMSVDLEEVTSKYIRTRLEEEMNMKLSEYKWYLDQEMLTILGQMDAPTEIFEYLFLGSEWNASNLEELKDKGINHILNVTREIDNFFPAMFNYYNIRVYDDDSTNLLPYWDDTYKYIRKAKEEGSKVLVHCKMGISRSASVVIAYAMKAYNWDLKKTMLFVKNKRNCIKPNTGFMKQLEVYQGMLNASRQRHSSLWRSKSETNLKSPDQLGQAKTGMNCNIMKSTENINLTPDDSGLAFRPKSWSPNDSVAQELLPCETETDKNYRTNQIGLENRQRSVTDPSCYSGVCHYSWPLEDSNSNSVTNFQETQRSCTNTVQMTSLFSIQHRITELEFQVSSSDTLKTSKTDLTNKSGLVLNLATQFETGNKIEPVFCVDANNMTCESAFQSACEISSDSVFCHTKPLIPKPQPGFSKCELPTLVRENILGPNSIVGAPTFGRPRSVSANEVQWQYNELFKGSTSVSDNVRKQKVESKYQASMTAKNSKSENSLSPSTKPSQVSKAIKQQEKLFFKPIQSSLDSNFSTGTSFVPKKLFKDSSFFRPTETTSEQSATSEIVQAETGNTMPQKDRFSYEKESIPWTPGTVKRTRQQIEEKRKSFCCENYCLLSNSHSTPSTPPELGLDCEIGTRKNIQRSHSLRCDKRPLSQMFPVKWFPLPALAKNGPTPPKTQWSKYECLDFGFSEERTDMPHSASMPSMVEAVNKVICGTQEVLNSAIQSVSSESSRSATPKLQLRSELDNIIFSSDTRIEEVASPLTDVDVYQERPAPMVVKLQRDKLGTLNPKNLTNCTCKFDGIQEDFKTKRSKIKECGKILARSDDTNEDGKGVVKKLTKELEAKSGYGINGQVLILDKEGKEQNFAARPWRSNSSPSSPNIDSHIKSTSQSTSKDIKLMHKVRALSDILQETAPLSGHLAFPMETVDKSKSFFRKAASPSLPNLAKRKSLVNFEVSDKETLHSEISRKSVIGLSDNDIHKDVMCTQFSHSDLQHPHPQNSQKKTTILSEGVLEKEKRIQGNSQSLNWVNHFSKTM
ncbi:uncharacterized protein LOC143236006 isoform X2 [Tachypleus tridentatus]|uniref:uncharacterized protein LOC143236006 isoform X2 n=1 Tax=Tachypleus tridentatus TaxID=6853 RepID=UPI003FD18485